MLAAQWAARLDRVLSDALADAAARRSEFAARRLARGVDFIDASSLRMAVDAALTRLRGCASGGSGPVAGEMPLPASGATGRVWATGREALNAQVLAPAQVEAWLGRVYAAEMYCHREGATIYQAAILPFIDAAESVALMRLEQDLESRALRTRGELERRLGRLDNVLRSAVAIDDALTEHGVRGVSSAGTSLRNLEGGARSQREGFERALEALDSSSLEAERERLIAETRDHYARERAALEAWRMRFDPPPDITAHPTLDPDGVPLDFPYGPQTRDRALQNGVLGAANAAQNHLNACRAVNARAAALVAAGPVEGGCSVWPPRDRFAQWGFIRVVERETVDRCNVDLALLDAPVRVIPPAPERIALERLAARAAEVAAAARPASLASVLADIAGLTSDFNERLGSVESRFASIREKLATGAAERLDPITPPPQADEVTPAPNEVADDAETAAPVPVNRHEMCLARERERRAAMAAGLDVTVFVRYDEDAYLGQWAGRPRPDGRTGSVDACQEVTCPASVTRYEDCIHYDQAERKADLDALAAAQARQRADEVSNLILGWVPGAHASMQRFYHQPEGDTWLDRTADRATTLACTISSLAVPVRRGVSRLLAAGGGVDPCEARLGARFDSVLGR